MTPSASNCSTATTSTRSPSTPPSPPPPPPLSPPCCDCATTCPPPWPPPFRIWTATPGGRKSSAIMVVAPRTEAGPQRAHPVALDQPSLGPHSPRQPAGLYQLRGPSGPAVTGGAGRRLRPGRG